MKKQKMVYDRIDASFYTIKDVMKTDFIERFLKILDQYADEFGIQGYTYSHASKPRYKPIDKETLIKEYWKSEDTIGRKLPWINFGGNKPYLYRLSLLVDDGKIIKNRYNMSTINASIDKSYFSEGTREQQQKRIETYLIFCKQLYDLMQPLCTYAHDVDDEHAISVSLSKKGLYRFLGFFYSTHFGHIQQPHIDCPIGGIYWLNYFGPRCVEFYGKDRLLNAPGVVRRENLNDGGMLLLTAPHPLTPDDPEHRANQLALWKYLGLKPQPNIKMIAKYKSADRWKDAVHSWDM